MLKKILFASTIALILSFSLKMNASAEMFPIEDIVKNNANAVVLIGAVGPKGSSFGSGFIISPDGMILTNLHVVNNAIKIGVKLKSNKTYNNVIVVSSDTKKDIAVLKIDGSRFKSVILGNSNNVQPGEKVVAIGNPLGLENTVSDGLISSIRDMGRGLKVLQITVPISPGSSGCPLFNMQGEVVGIAVGTNVNGQNINFAIPINDAKKLLRPETRERNHQNQKDYHESKKTDTHSYFVKRGDTLFDLARRFNTTVEILTRINDLSNTNIIVGQILNIPSSR